MKPSGAVAVVVTLIYPASQLRQNTQALRSSTYESINASAFSWSDSVMEHVTEFAEIFQRTDLDQLTPEQHILLDTYAFKSFTVMESFYLHHRAGTMDDDVYAARLAGCLNTLSNSQLLREKWESWQQYNSLTSELIEFMDKQLKNYKPPEGKAMAGGGWARRSRAISHPS